MFMIPVERVALLPEIISAINYQRELFWPAGSVEPVSMTFTNEYDNLFNEGTGRTFRRVGIEFTNITFPNNSWDIVAQCDYSRPTTHHGWGRGERSLWVPHTLMALFAPEPTCAAGTGYDEETDITCYIVSHRQSTRSHQISEGYASRLFTKQCDSVQVLNLISMLQTKHTTYHYDFQTVVESIISLSNIRPSMLWHEDSAAPTNWLKDSLATSVGVGNVINDRDRIVAERVIQYMLKYKTRISSTTREAMRANSVARFSSVLELIVDDVAKGVRHMNVCDTVIGGTRAYEIEVPLGGAFVDRGFTARD